MGKADSKLDQPGEEWLGHLSRNLSDGYNHAQCKSCFSAICFCLVRRGRANDLDDIELVKDMPICLQVVGGRFGEEKAVSVAKVVDRLMHS